MNGESLLLLKKLRLLDRVATAGEFEGWRTTAPDEVEDAVNATRVLFAGGEEVFPGTLFDALGTVTDFSARALTMPYDAFFGCYPVPTPQDTPEEDAVMRTRVMSAAVCRGFMIKIVSPETFMSGLPMDVENAKLSSADRGYVAKRDLLAGFGMSYPEPDLVAAFAIWMAIHGDSTGSIGGFIREMIERNRYNANERIRRVCGVFREARKWAALACPEVVLVLELPESKLIEIVMDEANLYPVDTGCAAKVLFTGAYKLVGDLTRAVWRTRVETDDGKVLTELFWEWEREKGVNPPPPKKMAS